MTYQRKEVIGDATLYLADCLEVLPEVGPVDSIVTDPPYSERTHSGHDSGAARSRDGADRRVLGYEALSTSDLPKIASLFATTASGWVVWMCDDEQAVPIRNALEASGRYGFAPLPFVAPGSRVRLTGDGPSAWTIWIVVARTKSQIRWGTLPGAYILPKGAKDQNYMGGKPIWLMNQLVRDYSLSGQTVLDPYMGSGTTGVACANLGRRFVGVEIKPEAFDIACERISAAYSQGRLFA